MKAIIYFKELPIGYIECDTVQSTKDTHELYLKGLLVGEFLSENTQIELVRE